VSVCTLIVVPDEARGSGGADIWGGWVYGILLDRVTRSLTPLDRWLVVLDETDWMYPLEFVLKSGGKRMSRTNTSWLVHMSCTWRA